MCLIQKDPSKYQFVAQGMLTIDGVDDAEEMRITDEAFDILGFTQVRSISILILTRHSFLLDSSRRKRTVCTNVQLPLCISAIHNGNNALVKNKPKLKQLKIAKKSLIYWKLMQLISSKVYLNLVSRFEQLSLVSLSLSHSRSSFDYRSVTNMSTKVKIRIRSSILLVLYRNR